MSELKAAALVGVTLVYLLLLEVMIHAVPHCFPAPPARDLAAGPARRTSRPCHYG